MDGNAIKLIIGRRYEQAEPGFYLMDQNGSVVLSDDTMPKDEDLRRIAACWNACAGVPTELLESVGVHFGDAYMKAAALADTMTEERDELKHRLEGVEAAAREALEWLKDLAMRDRMPAPLVDNLLRALGDGGAA